jgi:hypothetical protein
LLGRLLRMLLLSQMGRLLLRVVRRLMRHGRASVGVQLLLLQWLLLLRLLSVHGRIRLRRAVDGRIVRRHVGVRVVCLRLRLLVRQQARRSALLLLLLLLEMAQVLLLLVRRQAEEGRIAQQSVGRSRRGGHVDVGLLLLLLVRLRVGVGSRVRLRVLRLLLLLHGHVHRRLLSVHACMLHAGVLSQQVRGQNLRLRLRVQQRHGCARSALFAAALLGQQALQRVLDGGRRGGSG